MQRAMISVIESPGRLMNSARKWLSLGVVVIVSLVALTAGPLVSGQDAPDKPEQKKAAVPPQVRDNDPDGRLDRAKKMMENQKKEIRDRTIKTLENQVKELKQQADQLRGFQGYMRDGVRNKCGLSPENVTPVMLELERNLFALEIEVKLKTARCESLAKLLAKETEQRRQRAENDEIIEQLKKIVAARKDALSVRQAKHDAAAAGGSELELTNAEAELAEAQFRLALRKQDGGKSREETSIDRLNQQLLEVSVEATQDELRLQLLKGRLRALREVEPSLDHYKNTTESELPPVLRLLEQVQTELTNIKMPHSD